MYLERRILFLRCLDGILMLRLWLLRLDHFLLLRKWGLNLSLLSRLPSIPSMDFDILLGTLELVNTVPQTSVTDCVALSNKAVIRTGWTVVGLTSVSAIALALM